MSAGASGGLTRRPMTVTDLGAVMALEAQAYSHPWSQGNFVDSLAAGHLAEVLLDEGLIGYFVAMHGVEELHLLNVTVAPAVQGRGHGSALLGAVLAHARACGLRTSYYPAVRGREDAVVMRRAIEFPGASQLVSAGPAGESDALE
jgi:[ribosomal protein S18]-alanine N-acetyltransferase